MGKMKMNPQEFSNDPNATPIIPEVILPSDAKPKKPPVPPMPTSDHNLKIKWDMVSNIVSDACGVINEIIRAVSAVTIERERTRQAEINAGAQIRAAEEHTEQVRIQETEVTERTRIQYLAEIKKAEYQLQEKQKEMEIARAKNDSDKQKYDEALKTIQMVIEHIISQNKEYMQSQSNQPYTDAMHQNNEQLIRLLEQVTAIYTAKT